MCFHRLVGSLKEYEFAVITNPHPSRGEQDECADGVLPLHLSPWIRKANLPLCSSWYGLDRVPLTCNTFTLEP